jgi:hypothetical protein
LHEPITHCLSPIEPGEGEARRLIISYRGYDQLDRCAKSGFFVFSQARVRPLTYREPMRFALSIGKRLRSRAEGVKHPEVPLILVVEGGHILGRMTLFLAIMMT